MKFRVSEAELARSQTTYAKREKERQREALIARVKKKAPNSCVVFICDNPRTHYVVRPNYYSDGSGHRIPFCHRHATELVSYWIRERKINCHVEEIKGQDV